MIRKIFSQSVYTSSCRPLRPAFNSIELTLEAWLQEAAQRTVVGLVRAICRGLSPENCGRLLQLCGNERNMIGLRSNAAAARASSSILVQSPAATASLGATQLPPTQMTFGIAR